ncbi:MAG: hypothetical protein Q7T57_06850 [Dehalococcoidales bacterium]|nr:hypothetical protein [Dehalococcoidales bacterium]
MKEVKHGAKRTLEFDSHCSPNEFEYVMFDSRHILPRYVISFEAIKAPGSKFDGSAEQMGADAYVLSDSGDEDGEMDEEPKSDQPIAKSDLVQEFKF